VDGCTDPLHSLQADADQVMMCVGMLACRYAHAQHLSTLQEEGRTVHPLVDKRCPAASARAEKGAGVVAVCDGQPASVSDRSPTPMHLQVSVVGLLEPDKHLQGEWCRRATAGSHRPV
jgi:hypothetical protein